MSGRTQRYELAVIWTGNRGSGTSDYRAYSRDYRITSLPKLEIAGSADPAFLGDPARWNPEELLLASLAACHQLWYLHLAADAGLVVVDYLDTPVGTMVEAADGSGQFAEVELRPQVTLGPGGDTGLAQRLHAKAHAKCFIARSVNFPVRCLPTVRYDRRTAP